MAIIARVGQERPRRPRRRRLRTVSTLPTLLTLCNLVCGFAAVHFCMRAMLDWGAAGGATSVGEQLTTAERLLPSFPAIAAGFIFLGLLADAFDGSLARLMKRTSAFGGQLDSLADMVTFGVAPAALVVALVMTQPEAARGPLPGPLSGTLAGRALWMMAAIYVACAGLRLARFNVEHENANVGHRRFVGLPSPGAAVVIASCVLLHEELGAQYAQYQPYLALALPFVALALGLLMVSRVPYVHLANAYLHGRRPFDQVVALVVVLAVFWWYKELTLAVVVSVYAFSGPVAAAVRRLRPTGIEGPVAELDADEAPSVEDEPVDPDDPESTSEGDQRLA